MSATEDLTELVERAGAAERAALASKWKERSDVEALQRKVRHAIDNQRDLERRASTDTALTGRRAQLREAFSRATSTAENRPAAPRPPRAGREAAPSMRHRSISPPGRRSMSFRAGPSR